MKFEFHFLCHRKTVGTKVHALQGREISFLHAVMYRSVYNINANEIPNHFTFSQQFLLWKASRFSATVISSHVKILFRTKAHLVFHWCSLIRLFSSLTITPNLKSFIHLVYNVSRLHPLTREGRGGETFQTTTHPVIHPNLHPSKHSSFVFGQALRNTCVTHTTSFSDLAMMRELCFAWWNLINP